MRIEMEGLKKPEEDHDASVLNPEQSCGADLSRKERRLLEKEKIKGMGFKKKLEYFWMYYKWVLIVVIALIVGGKLGMDWYHNLQIDTVLAISVVNSSMTDSEAVTEEIKKVLGCEGDEYSSVEIAGNLTTGQDGTEFDYYAQMAYSTQVQARGIDVLIFPESLYERANSSGIFDNLENIMDEETKAALGDRLKGDYITFGPESSLGEELGVYYQPVCLAVPASAKNTENAVKWIADLVEE